MEESKNTFLSVTVWEPGTGGQDVKTRAWVGPTGQLTRETTRRNAMHRSKLDIGGADAEAGGLSISSSSGDAGASSTGASTPSARAHSGSGSICFATSRQWRAARWPFHQPPCAQATPPSCPSLVLVAEVRDCARYAHRAKDSARSMLRATVNVVASVVLPCS